MATLTCFGKLAVILSLCSPCFVAMAQSRPKAPIRSKVSKVEKTKATEAKFAQLAASSGKASAQLDKINAELDQLIKSLHDFHVRIAKP